MFPGRPTFRSKRGNRCMLVPGHICVYHCPNCGITKTITGKNRGDGTCKRCGKEWKIRTY